MSGFIEGSSGIFDVAFSTFLEMFADVLGFELNY